MVQFIIHLKVFLFPPTCILNPYSISLQSNKLLSKSLESKDHVAHLATSIIIPMIVVIIYDNTNPGNIQHDSNITDNIQGDNTNPGNIQEKNHNCSIRSITLVIYSMRMITLELYIMITISLIIYKRIALTL